MKIAVIGANGQLGRDICKVFKNSNEVIELNHEHLDITDQLKTNKILREISPQFVVNTAAMHNVEECETNPTLTFAVNGIGARHLAIASKELGFTLIHFSTDYVYDGKKNTPYIESDSPMPLNVYGNTKLSGELFIQSIAEKYYILRISGIYGENQCRAKGGLNFVTFMMKLSRERDEVRVIDNEIVSPTFTMDIANQVVQLTSIREYGLYHLSSQGYCSWYDFAGRIFKLTNTAVNLKIASPDEFPAKVPRPLYSVLENKRMKDIGIDSMPHWEESLKNYLSVIGEL